MLILKKVFDLVDFYKKFEYQRLLKSQVLEILKISNDRMVEESNEYNPMSKPELTALTNEIESLNPDLIFLKNNTIKFFNHHQFNLDGRLIFFKNGYKYSTLFSINSLENKFEDIKLISRNFYQRKFYYGSDYEFVDMSKNVIRNTKTTQHIILDEDILSKKFFIENKTDDFVLLMQNQFKKIFNLNPKNIRLIFANEVGFIFLVDNFLIIKIFKTTIEKDLLIFLMKNFKIKLQELKAPVIINGFFKLHLLTVNNINLENFSFKLLKQPK